MDPVPINFIELCICVTLYIHLPFFQSTRPCQEKTMLQTAIEFEQDSINYLGNAVEFIL